MSYPGSNSLSKLMQLVKNKIDSVKTTIENTIPNYAEILNGNILTFYNESEESLFGITLPSSSGSWTPTCDNLTSLTSSGSYMKVGKVVTISFYLKGTSRGRGDQSNYIYRIKGLPFTPSTATRWYGGGGAMTGGYTAANNSFCGFTLDTADSSGSCILPRSINYSTSDGARTLYYIYEGSSNSQQVYISGTIQYLTT